MALNPSGGASYGLPELQWFFEVSGQRDILHKVPEFLEFKYVVGLGTGTPISSQVSNFPSFFRGISGLLFFPVQNPWGLPISIDGISPQKISNGNTIGKDPAVRSKWGVGDALVSI